MKKILTFLFLTFVGLSLVIAQPQKMTYQVVVRNSNNELVVNQQVGVQVLIREDSASGPIVYHEIHSVSTNGNGLLSLMIGDGLNQHALQFTDIQWGEHEFFLQVDIDPAGGINYTISGVQQLLTVPYSFYAQRAGYADTTLFAISATSTDTANYALNTSFAANAGHANYSDTANYSHNGYHSAYTDTATFAHNANFAANTSHANYSDTANYSHNGYHSAYSDTANFAHNANHANYSDTAVYSHNGYHSAYSDTATFAHNANHAVDAGHSNYSDTANYSHNGYHSAYADTATFAHNANLAVNAGHANYSDTATFAHNAGNANYAATSNYADSARISNYANASGIANYSDSARISDFANAAGTANTANYADSTRVADYAYNAGAAATAHYADSTRVSDFAYSANYADTADFNKLLNRPTGTNTGDMLYWQTSDSAWHVTPVGNNGQVLSLDNNSTPQWSTVPNLASYSLASVYTNAVTNYTGYTATATGYVSNAGNSPFVVSGFCWSTSANPTTSNEHSIDGLGVSSFSHVITGLNIGTTYHVRAYAINSAGTSYGADQQFTTWTYPTVTTNASVTTISATTAYCGGNVTSDGGASVTARGVCWNTSGNPTINNSKTTNGSGTGSFNSYMTGLSWGTTYYVRAYATNAISTTYGSQVTFKTLDQPTVTTNSITGIDTTSAMSGGNVTADGGDPVTARGICWNTTGSPTISNTHTTNGSGLGSFVDTMKNLTPGTTYYVRAYATNSISTNYGSQYNFKANPVKPTVTTTHPSNVQTYTATGGGNVTNSGGANVTQRGVCYNTTGSPTKSNSTVTTNGTGTGSYSSSLSGLQPGTKYYIRAYADNSAGTGYGAVDSFTTAITYPTVTTNPVTNTATYTAVSGGNVTATGGDSVTARGIVWRAGSWPTISNYNGIDTSGAGLGTFTDTMKGLTNATTYYVKAWARNSYGATVSSSGYTFTTLPAPPTVATSATVTNITGTTATSGGTITSNGGATITYYGICWDTVPTPVLGTNNYTSDSWYYYNNIPYQYTTSCSNLLDSTTYWVCAYATNSYGTSYGTPVSFTTAKLPTVVTEPVIDVTTTGAYSGVTVLADGGNSVSVSGVCWSTSPNPTISNSKSLDGSSGVIPFTKTSLIFDLDDTTTYYVRAYATTDMGTGYGQAISFTTHAFPACPGVTTVSDTDGNVYSTVLIGTQCWMRENLRTTKYPDGTNIAAGVVTETAVGFRYGAGTSPRGYLYNYVALMHGASPSNSIPSGVQGICPNGWHIPSYMEWQILYNYVNSLSSWVCSNGNNGRALASKTAWYQNSSYKAGCYISAYERPNSTRNISGLGLLPYGSYRQDGSSIHNQNYNCYIWSCSKTGTSIYCNYGNYGDYSFYQTTVPEYYGLSVRCIKDYTPPVANYVSPCPNATSVSDNDGHTYNTVQIGTQCWMKENLRTTKYPDGTQITYGYGNNTSTQIGYYYHVSNNSSNDATYGLMYNWVAAMDSSTTEGAQGICPQGWHIPTYNEYNYLKYYVLIHSSCGEGQALAATTNWTTYSDNSCSVGYNLTNNNASGFSLQPAGYYYYCCGTGDVKNTAEIWSSTESSATNSYRLYLYYTSTQASVGTENNGYGLSVRCIKD